MSTTRKRGRPTLPGRVFTVRLSEESQEQMAVIERTLHAHGKSFIQKSDVIRAALALAAVTALQHTED